MKTNPTPTNPPTETDISHARNECRECGYDISHIQSEVNAQRDWLCFQCYVNRDNPDQETLEGRF